jgi:biopolymer transport protein ExbB
MKEFAAKAEEFLQQALQIWLSGGWAMIAIAIIAMVMFGVGLSTMIRLREKRSRRVPERIWRTWIEYPERRRGRIGELLNIVTRGKTIEDMEARFEELQLTETAPFERDLRVMKVCVSASPLVGLLGTVTGMLSTFAALSSGSGGDETLEMVAGGISEALVTTMTGLVIALPGLFFQYRLSRGVQRYKAFLSHVESACMQTRHRRQIEESLEPEAVIDRAARRKVLAALQRSAAEHELSAQVS